MSVVKEFDPYECWLGIRPQERPVDYYRLLGLKRFERDRKVISVAAKRSIARISRHLDGEHAAEARRVLSRMESAQDCLLHEGTKKAYDRKLRRRVIPSAGDSDNRPKRRASSVNMQAQTSSIMQERELAAKIRREIEGRIVERMLIGVFVVALGICIAILAYEFVTPPVNDSIAPPAAVEQVEPSDAAAPQPSQ